MRHITLLLGMLVAMPAMSQVPAMQPDIPANFKLVVPNADFEKREIMIPMRDGTKLFTVVVLPKGAKSAPIILTRTPYDAANRAKRNATPTMLNLLPQGDEDFVRAGYIRIFQDVRGKHGSEGDYVMTRPPRGPLNSTSIDHATDAWDTIDWLVKNLPESNGRVGMIGSSYEGFTVLMALTEPHSALKVAVPMSPMVDGWMGDDWFHAGAFRQNSWSFLPSQTAARGPGPDISQGVADDWQAYLEAGSSGDYARRFGIDKMPFAQKLMQHASYDQFWQEQALDKILGKLPLKVPTMTVVGQWDQEDIYGAYALYAALEPKDTANDRNFLVIGPWRHSGVNYEGSSLGVLKFEGDTARQFRRDTMQPFLDQYLKPGHAKANTPPVLSYQSGGVGWQSLDSWPKACETACKVPLKPLYLGAEQSLSFTPPARAGADSYISDPAKPVPFVQRPIRMEDRPTWTTWLVSDQRNAAARPDVLSFMTVPLEQDVVISGAPVMTFFASTTGTDIDWVVKLIDVYPDETPNQPELGGYQLPVSLDIFRGRYRESYEVPKAIAANTALEWRIALPNANHRFRAGHRIMVQVQSTLFPLYDRNPQTFVPNIFNAKPGDYKPATQTLLHGPGKLSAILLPVVPD